MRTTGPAEDLAHQSSFEAGPPERAASAEDDPLETLRETAETLRAAAAALRAAQLDGEQAHRRVLSALYHAEDDQGCNLVEAHQILRFSLPNRNASDQALYGASQVLEAATDALFGANHLFEQIRWLDDFGEVKAASTLRAAIAGLNVAGLLEAAGDAVSLKQSSSPRSSGTADPGRYFNPRSWQAPKGLGHERGADELRGLWDSLVQQVREAGLVLGTGAQEPSRRDPAERRAWALPDGYSFDRNAANQR